MSVPADALQNSLSWETGFCVMSFKKKLHCWYSVELSSRWVNCKFRVTIHTWFTATPRVTFTACWHPLLLSDTDRHAHFILIIIWLLFK